MRPDILILGQGIAGTMLGWELERTGISFAIVDPGPTTAATAAGAGILNPVTGRRLVKSWQVDTLLPAARAIYRELETALAVPLWHEMTVRRFFADERERTVARQKTSRGALAPYVRDVDDEGIWIHEAARVDLGSLIEHARRRWEAAGRLRAAAADLGREIAQHALVIDCTGRAAALSGRLDFLPWEFSKGEILELAVNGLAPEVVLNRRHWVLPVGPGKAWVGATHEPGVRDSEPSSGAREMLIESAKVLLKHTGGFAITGHRAGVRVNIPDKRPVAGRHPDEPRIGVLNGLGAKGALWAPMLARQWVNHLTRGTPFDPEIDVQRFGEGKERGEGGRR
jgi:glycine/D-amino acid oxidase-like deaminating enzyme